MLFSFVPLLRIGSYGSAVGIVTVYGLNDRESEVRVPVGSRIFTSQYCALDHFCGLVVRVLGYRSGGSGSFPGTIKKM
jgi:hypothetical protein